MAHKHKLQTKLMPWLMLMVGPLEPLDFHNIYNCRASEREKARGKGLNPWLELGRKESAGGPQASRHPGRERFARKVAHAVTLVLRHRFHGHA